MPPDNPLRVPPNVNSSPHIGDVTRDTLHAFYRDGVEAVACRLESASVRILNPRTLDHVA